MPFSPLPAVRSSRASLASGANALCRALSPQGRGYAPSPQFRVRQGDACCVSLLRERTGKDNASSSLRHSGRQPLPPQRRPLGLKRGVRGQGETAERREHTTRGDARRLRRHWRASRKAAGARDDKGDDVSLWDTLLEDWLSVREEIRAAVERQRDSGETACAVARLTAAIQAGQEAGASKAKSAEQALLTALRENEESPAAAGASGDSLLQRDLCLFKAVSTNLALEHLSVRLLTLLLSHRRHVAPAASPPRSFESSPASTTNLTTLSGAGYPDVPPSPQPVSKPQPVCASKETVCPTEPASEKYVSAAAASPRPSPCVSGAVPLFPVSTRVWVDKAEGKGGGSVSAWVYRQLLVLGALSLLPRASGFAVQMPVLRYLLARVFPTVGETPDAQSESAHARREEEAERTSDMDWGRESWHPAVVFRVSLQSLSTCPLPSLPLEVQRKCWVVLYFSLWHWDIQQHGSFLCSSSPSAAPPGERAAPTSLSLSPSTLASPAAPRGRLDTSSSPSSGLVSPAVSLSASLSAYSPFPDPPLAALVSWTCLQSLAASSTPPPRIPGVSSSSSSPSADPAASTSLGSAPETFDSVAGAAGQAVALCSAREAVQLLQALNHLKHQLVELPFLADDFAAETEASDTEARNPGAQPRASESLSAAAPASSDDALGPAAALSPRRRSEAWLAGLQDLLLRVLTGTISAVGLAETRGILGSLGRQEVRDAVFVHSLAHRVAELMGEVPERSAAPQSREGRDARAGAQNGQATSGEEPPKERGVSEGRPVEQGEETSALRPSFAYSGKRLKLSEMHNIVMLAMKAEVYDQHLIDALARLIVGEAPPAARQAGLAAAGTDMSARACSEGDGEALERAQLGCVIGIVQTLGKLQARTTDSALFERMMLALCEELHRRHAFIHDCTTGQVLLGLTRLRFVHPPLIRALALKTTRAASRQNAQQTLQQKVETPRLAPVSADAVGRNSPASPDLESEEPPGLSSAAGVNTNHYVLAANMISRNGFYSFSLLQQVIKLQLTSGATTSVLAMTQMLATLARFGDFQPADSHLRLLIRWCLPRFVAELLRRPASAISPLNASQLLCSFAKLRYVDVPFVSHLLSIFTSPQPSSLRSSSSSSPSAASSSASSNEVERNLLGVEVEVPRSSPLAFPRLPPCPFDIRGCRRVLKTLDAAALVSIVEAVDAMNFWSAASLHLLYQIKCILEDSLHDLKASQIIAICLAFRDWHYRDWELPDAMVAGEALDESTDEEEFLLTPERGDLSSDSSLLGASAALLMQTASPPFQPQPLNSFSFSASLASSSSSSSASAVSPLARGGAVGSEVRDIEWQCLHRSAWKEELVLNCVEALERHESFALSNWLCMQKLKTLVDALHLDLFFPYFSWFLASSPSARLLPPAASRAVSAVGGEAKALSNYAEEAPGVGGSVCRASEELSPKDENSPGTHAVAGNSVGKTEKANWSGTDGAPLLQYEVLDLTPPVYVHPALETPQSSRGERPGGAAQTVAGTQGETRAVSLLERFQVLPPWLWRQLVKASFVSRGEVEANRHLHDREGDDASEESDSREACARPCRRDSPAADQVTPAPEGNETHSPSPSSSSSSSSSSSPSSSSSSPSSSCVRAETPLEASHPPVLHPFGHRGAGAVIEDVGPFRVFVGPFVRGMRVDVVVESLPRGPETVPKKKEKKTKKRRKQKPRLAPEPDETT
nr:hypothetical protein TgIa.0080 [Toxoplasma gondii RH]